MGKLPKEQSDETLVAADLAFLEQVRWFRMTITERITQASASDKEQVLQMLRQEATVQLAEFLYLLMTQNIRTPAQVERMAELHNAYVVTVTKDTAKLKRLGLESERLLDSMFTADTLPRLVENWREDAGAIDQSNLARFLGVVMSAETCRKVVVACAEAGLLKRWRTPYGTYLIKSTGKMEQIFSSTLREARAIGA